jgi:hypothetical protein
MKILIKSGQIALIILIFFLFGIGLSCQTDKTTQLTAQELKIYKIILGEKPKEIVVIDESMVGVFGEISTGKLKEILEGLQDDTFDNFANVNSTTISIGDSTQTTFDYPLVSKVDFERKNLQLNRYYVFSRVGFSNDGKQAVVIFVDNRNPLGAKGAYFLLVNKNGIWEIIQESESWRS